MSWLKRGKPTALKGKRHTKAPHVRLGVVIICLVFLLAGGEPEFKGQAATDSAYDLIAAVNQLRQSNGLAPYQINGSLMAAAQGHSEYQASIGTVTHTGAGGSTAKTRAIAAGYGGGATIYVSENIAGGTNMSYQTAFQMWQGDSLHLNTMLGASYTDVGAGVASSGDQVYFTLDVGYIAGAAGSAPPSSGTSSLPVPPTPIPFLPVITSTPAADGSVTHSVLTGQTLWVIAAMYEVNLADLLELNNFSNSTLIFPGDLILIKPASITPSPTVPETAIKPALTATLRPTRTASPAASQLSTPLADLSNLQTLTAAPLDGEKPPVQDPALLLIAVFVLGGTIFMIIGFMLKRREHLPGSSPADGEKDVHD